jgi:hypothetical protein
LREVFYPVLKLREEKQIWVRVGGGKVDFFLDSICVGSGLVVSRGGP